MMKQLVIIFVPAGMEQRDFEAALREHLGSVPTGETPAQTRAGQVKITDNDQMPLSTWFISDSGRAR
jgi:hypothetical protein